MPLLEQFFELLRSGLWARPADASFFSEGKTNWESIYRLSQQQTVIALVFDGIETLPVNLRPPRTLYMKWCTKVARIEAANQQLDEAVLDTFQLYKEAGLKPILLKGQGIAANYPHSGHRQCGDIDLYFGKKQYNAANRTILRAGGIPELEDSIKHAGFHYWGAHIENHRIAGTLNHPSSNRKLQQMIKKYLPESQYTESILGQPIPVPPPTANIIYIFIHAFNHFLIGGIGLRQICDWARISVVKSEEIDKREVTETLHQMKLTLAASAFARIAVQHLGLPADKVPFEYLQAEEEADILLAEILLAGNFGQFDQRFGIRPTGYWRGKWFTYQRALKRSKELRRFARSEASWSGIVLMRGTLAAQWYKLKKKFL